MHLICKVAMLGTLISPLAQCQRMDPMADLALVDVVILDVDAGSVTPNQTVLVTDGKIQAVRDIRNNENRAAKTVIDASGNYLMPGLWDMHIHLDVDNPDGTPQVDPDRWHVPLALSYGVTGLRDMASPMDEILSLRDTLDDRRATGTAAPELVVAGTLFSGKQPWGEPDHAVIPETVDAARQQVRDHIDLGVDFIKVHDFLDPDIYRAIVEEAIEGGRPVIGHLRADVGPVEASKLGQRDFEHVPPELLAYCGPDGQGDTRKFYRNWYSGGPTYFWEAKADLFDSEGCSALFDELGRHDVTITPTLILRHRVSDARYERASTVLPPAYMTLCDMAYQSEADLPDGVFNRYDDVMAEAITQLSEADVTLLVGTDRQTHACGVPGWDVVEELKAFVAAGLSPQQALRATTTDAARKAGRNYPGQIVAGASADLVILRGNPLDDVDVLSEPLAVIAAGDYLNRDALEALRSSAASYAESL